MSSYTYLGFPIGPFGIDWGAHLTQRFTAMWDRTRWLATMSDAWGPRGRLQVYKQYLAPMAEYGAPLVWAWTQESTKDLQHLNLACEKWKDVLGWI